MKKRTALILLLLGILVTGLSAQDEKSPFRFKSLDIGATAMLPIGRYSDFTDYGFGGDTRLAMGRSSSPWDFGITFAATSLNSVDPYVNLMTSFSAYLDIGYQIPMGAGGWLFVPRLSGGVLAHRASGDFNTTSNENQAYYFDQYYGISTEFAYEPWAGDNPPSRWGFYVTPGFFIFPNQESFLGMNASLRTGVRINLARIPKTANSAESE